MRPVFLLLHTRTRIPASMSVPKTAASVGLPSRVAARTSPDGTLPPPPNHIDTGLDANIDRYNTGIQRVGEVRTDLSLSRKKSAATPTLQIRKASCEFI
jgi:hypothetical protein